MVGGLCEQNTSDEIDKKKKERTAQANSLFEENARQHREHRLSIMVSFFFLCGNKSQHRIDRDFHSPSMDPAVSLSAPIVVLKTPQTSGSSP
jgi:hypothetical protein